MFTYDEIGNPLTYRDGITMTWQNGRQLATLNNGTSSIAYTYDANGMRTGKTVTTGTSSVEWEYTYEGGQLLQMKRGNRILDFSYDVNGTPVGFSYRSRETATPTYYYYQLNSRGDVIGLYNSSGVLTYIYEYDAYGNVLSVTNSSGVEMTSETNIAILNPLRYRGYVYDNETGLYYLQTRYYDPTTCRFINADGLVSTGTGTLGYNMFAYCNNNSVLFTDSEGARPTVDGDDGDESGSFAYMNGRLDETDLDPEPEPEPVPTVDEYNWIEKSLLTAGSFLTSANFSLDVGYGLGGSANVFPGVDLSLVAKAAPIHFTVDREGFDFGTIVSWDAGLSSYGFGLGAGGYEEYSMVDDEYYSGYNEYYNISIINCELYLIAGASVSLGWNMNTFCNDFVEIWY